MMVIHVPSTVAGNPQGMSLHLRLLGVDSQSWALEQNYLIYPCDRVVWNGRQGMLARELWRWTAILHVATQADVVHFNFGISHPGGAGLPRRGVLPLQTQDDPAHGEPL